MLTGLVTFGRPTRDAATTFRSVPERKDIILASFGLDGAKSSRLTGVNQAGIAFVAGLKSMIIQYPINRPAGIIQLEGSSSMRPYPLNVNAWLFRQ